MVFKTGKLEWKTEKISIARKTLKKKKEEV